jgi:molybdenum cofactor synthesis domain-containing protein
MDVALVSVGDELLSGDTTNTNAAWLGRQLTDRGVTVERVTVVPDRVADIARVVDEYRATYERVIVTGGLGPTHDDVTIDGVAAAVGRDVTRHPEALAWLESEGGYARDDLADGTADLPIDARVLHNEVGVAPGCVVENVYVLPGVPEEMKAMFESVAGEFAGEVSHREVVDAGEPESALLDRLSELQREFDVEVGSYPGDHVQVRIQSTDPDEARRAAEWLRERVDGLETDE